MNASAKDLRTHTRQILDIAMRGEEVVIIYHGQPAARIIAYKKKKNTQSKQKLFGMWRNNPRVARPAAYLRSLRKGRFESSLTH
jgi:prevent-host-death family protein